MTLGVMVTRIVKTALMRRTVVNCCLYYIILVKSIFSAVNERCLTSLDLTRVTVSNTDYCQ